MLKDHYCISFCSFVKSKVFLPVFSTLLAFQIKSLSFLSTFLRRISQMKFLKALWHFNATFASSRFSKLSHRLLQRSHHVSSCRDDKKKDEEESLVSCITAISFSSIFSSRIKDINYQASQQDNDTNEASHGTYIKSNGI